MKCPRDPTHKTYSKQTAGSVPGIGPVTMESRHWYCQGCGGKDLHTIQFEVDSERIASAGKKHKK